MFTPQEQMIFDKVKAQFPEFVELVYVDYRNELSDDQLKMLFNDDWDSLWDSFADFESEAKRWGVDSYLDDAVKILTDEEREILDNSDDLLDELRYYLEDIDSSDWFAEVVRNSKPVTVMIPVIGEDNAEWHEQRNAKQIADALEIELTQEREELLDNLICEAPTDLGMAYIVAEIPAPAIQAGYFWVTIKDPILIYGNPFTGGVWNETITEMEISVNRKDMLLDGSWGYTVEDVYGGFDFNDSQIIVTDTIPQKVANLPYKG